MYRVTCKSMRCNLSFWADWKYGVCPRCGRSTALASSSALSGACGDWCPSQDDFPDFCLPARHSKSMQCEPPAHWWPNHTPHVPPPPPRGLRALGCLRSTGFSLYRIPAFPSGVFVYYPGTGHSGGRWEWHAYNILYNLR